VGVYFALVFHGFYPCIEWEFADRYERLLVVNGNLHQVSLLGSRVMSKVMLLLVLSLIVASHACAEVKVEKIEYKGWRNSYRVSNGEVELVVTGDIGPRVMRFGFVGGQNLFKEFADQLEE
jgi:hypothetical protein